MRAGRASKILPQHPFKEYLLRYGARCDRDSAAQVYHVDFCTTAFKLATFTSVPPKAMITTVKEKFKPGGNAQVRSRFTSRHTRAADLQRGSTLT